MYMANCYYCVMCADGLRQALHNVPGLEVLSLAREPRGESRLDALVEVRIARARLRLAIEWKNSLDSRFLDRAVEQLKSRTKGAVPMLAAPYVSPGIRRSLERQGVGWLDSFGNMHVQSAARLVHIERPIPRGAVPRPPGRRFGPSASRVAQALLEEPTHVFHLEDLGRKALITSSATVSRALTRFTREGLVDKTRAGWRVPDATRLLDMWLEARLRARGPLMAGFFATEPKSALLGQIARRSAAGGVALFLTGTAAAEALVPLLPAHTVDVYIFPPVAVSQVGEIEMGWVPSEKQPVIRMLLPSDDGPMVGAARHAGLPMVGRAQLLLDLMREGGRARQVVDALREKWAL